MADNSISKGEIRPEFPLNLFVLLKNYPYASVDPDPGFLTGMVGGGAVPSACNFSIVVGVDTGALNRPSLRPPAVITPIMAITAATATANTLDLLLAREFFIFFSWKALGSASTTPLLAARCCAEVYVFTAVRQESSNLGWDPKQSRSWRRFAGQEGTLKSLVSRKVGLTSGTHLYPGEVLHSPCFSAKHRAVNRFFSCFNPL